MNHKAPIFRRIFGKEWDSLPPVMHKHYANRAYSNDLVTAEGHLDVFMGWWAKLLSPFMHVTGALVPYGGEHIPVTVHFRSETHSNAFCLDRYFHFPKRKPFRFFSRMSEISGGDVVEWMKFGVGWRTRCTYDGRLVVLEHRGYVLRLMGFIIPIPLELLLGVGYAEEEALSDDSFRMRMTITHRLFGKVYEYKGQFTVKEMTLDQ
jgi:hypothetical protein